MSTVNNRARVEIFTAVFIRIQIPSERYTVFTDVFRGQTVQEYLFAMFARSRTTCHTSDPS